MKILSKNIFLACLLIAFCSCQKSSINDLQDAQLCLDKSVPASAKQCVEKIASDTSENGYKLKCAAVFISEGFNSPASFTSALDQIKSPTSSHGCTGSCSSTLAVMNSFNFSSGDNTQASNRLKNNNTAAEAFSYCSLSGVKIYEQISSLFKLGTMLTMLTPAVTAGGVPTVAQLQAAVSSLPPADVGAIVMTTYQSTCLNLTGASDSTKQYCAELGTAVAGGTTETAIGTCLIAKLNNPSATCP
ncbi:MAG: hypothetical protein WA160_09290 [Pseudobdellovibrio sp.]